MTCFRFISFQGISNRIVSQVKCNVRQPTMKLALAEYDIRYSTIEFKVLNWFPISGSVSNPI
ncbi:hypothetical protein BLOT_010954 [Blomia tropicalis]|nr:hypothetical protein BLOT_010954 [Blomia tropicalis]